MAIEFKNPADAVREQGIKMLVYGAAGSGKTVLCATANEPTLIISTEAGLLSIKDAPKRIQIVECNTGEEVDEVLDYLSQNKLPNWVCIDSISEIAEVVLAEELTKTKAPRKAYGELAVIMTALVKRFRNLHTNVVMTAKWTRSKTTWPAGSCTPLECLVRRWVSNCPTSSTWSAPCVARPIKRATWSANYRPIVMTSTKQKTEAAS